MAQFFAGPDSNSLVHFELSFGPRGTEQELGTKCFALTEVTSAVTHTEEVVCDVSGQISSITQESFKSDLPEQNIYSVH